MKHIKINCYEGRLLFKISPSYLRILSGFKNLPQEKLSFNELGEHLAVYILQDIPKAKNCCYSGIDFINYLNPIVL